MGLSDLHLFGPNFETFLHVVFEMATGNILFLVKQM
jgi:hypothetical protein